ncbi:MAG: hypothetical protein HRT67_05475 [Flavobacteriaceae bacterium]|nr:hypothetical protein [Flavobacteriaceae bacterium]
MTTINKLTIIFGLTIGLIVLISCQNESLYETENAQQIDLKSSTQKDEASKIDHLLTKLRPSIDSKSKKIGDFEAMTFEIVRNNDTGEITIENIKAEPYFPLNTNINKTGGYQIDCDMGGDGSNDWSDSCGGAYSCGKLAKKCLDAGGATACAQKATNSNYNSVKLIYVANLK